MDMPFLLTLIASFAFATCLAYALWVKVRKDRVRADLYGILADLTARAEELDCEGDPAYLKAFDEILVMAYDPECFSKPVLEYLIQTPQARVCAASSESEAVPAVYSVPEMQMAIENAVTKGKDRLWKYFSQETLSGRLFVWQQAKKAVKEQQAKPMVTQLMDLEGFLAASGIKSQVHKMAH